MNSSIVNILTAAMSPRNARVMLRKLKKRLEKDESIEALVWATREATKLEDFCNERSPKLWKESQCVIKNLNDSSDKILKSIPFNLGGGGALDLLYFLTRYSKPKIVLETGVAAGHSSKTILTAIQKNGEGHLYSSDFPYFRLKSPEKFIGVLVDDTFKSRWTLDIRGDEFAIPDFCKKLCSIDLFHYDSDKSYSGRFFVWDMIKPLLSDGSFIVFDDIQNNLAFRNLLKKEEFKNFWVFEHQKKFVGMTQFKKLTSAN